MPGISLPQTAKANCSDQHRIPCGGGKQANCHPSNLTTRKPQLRIQL